MTLTENSRSRAVETKMWGMLVSLALAGALALPVAPANAQTTQSGGRRGNEIRIPLRRGPQPRIPVVLVAPGEVRRPVVGSRSPGTASSSSFVPSYGGGMSRPPVTGSGGSTLFDRLVAPAGTAEGSAGYLPTPMPNDVSRPTSPLARSGAAAGLASAPGSPYPAAAVGAAQASGQRRPSVRVIPGGSGRIHVLPSGGGGSSGGAMGGPAGTGAYLIGPGDVLDVFVWRNEQLSRQVPVRPDGLISLPLVGEVVAAGKSAEQLQSELATLLSDYVQQPTVTVSVAEIKSLVVYVLGNVNRPGPLVMERNLTTLQAIAMAGGVNEFADRNDIVVLRTDAAGIQHRYTFRYDDVVGGKDLRSDLVLQAGDVIYVP